MTEAATAAKQRPVRDALGEAAPRLAAASETPRLDAELLMAHAMGIEREALLLSCQNDEAAEAFETLVRRRERGEPIAYIIGRRAFWTIELEVGPGALVPRPDSETLIEAAVAHFGSGDPRSVLDLGTGPGTLLLAALNQWPQARGIGVDVSDKALGFARRNAERLGLADRVDFRLGNWAEGVEEHFDLVLCNPPYIEADASLPADVAEWEPPEALFAGEDGLDDYRRLAPQIGRLIAPGGVACIEIGAAQEATVTELFRSWKLNPRIVKDLAGRPRCLVVRD
jgi:release factor glutamine methyltransferase